MNGLDLSWRVDKACLDALPARRDTGVAGWLFRASGGPIRRINSVNPTRMASFDPAPVLTDARRHYADLRQPLVFRVPSIAAGLDDALTAHGFGSPQAAIGQADSDQ